MTILNYTTRVPVEKTAAEIQKILVSGKASAVMTEYNDKGILKSLSFKMNTPHGMIGYRLPANVGGVQRLLMKSKRAEKSQEQAARVAWRIVKDWIEAQVSLVQAEMVTMDEVFLQYAITGTGQTLYERFSVGGGGTLGITYQENEDGR